MEIDCGLARIITGEEIKYVGGANPRGRDADLGNVYDIGAQLSAHHLHYHHELHHELTYKSHSITKLGFLCKHVVNRGDVVGWSYVSDFVQVHDYIIEMELGQKLQGTLLRSTHD